MKKKTQQLTQSFRNILEVLEDAKVKRTLTVIETAIYLEAKAAIAKSKIK